MPPAVRWACPSCRGALEADSLGLHCRAEGLQFPRRDGILRCLSPKRAEHHAPFLRQYEAIRDLEAWRQDGAADYRALPFRDPSGRHSDIWRIRARSYETLISDVIVPLERDLDGPLRLIDMGAGNCWLSNRLAQRGHHIAAVDLCTTAGDGLGAHINYDTAFEVVQADFDYLPFASGQFDLVIFNGSIHYTNDYAATLSESFRIMGKQGRVVLMDTPLYRDASSGAAMIDERLRHYQERLDGDALAPAGRSYLTFAQLDELAESLAVNWTLSRPRYGLRWRLRPLIAKIRRTREPATFAVVVGNRVGI